MTSSESTEKAVWLSGDEDVYFVSQLLEDNSEPRATGRTIRLALKYVELSLKVAPARVMVEDHHPSAAAQDGLINHIRRIFNAINIDYRVQEVKVYEKDDSSFTGTTPTGKKVYYLYAEPKGLKF